MMIVEVINWEKFQTYKDRRPTWIKLWTSLFENHEFMALSNEDKWLLISVWMFVAKYGDTNGVLEFDSERFNFITRRECTDLSPFEDTFLKTTDAIESVPKCTEPYGTVPQRQIQSTETEKEGSAKRFVKPTAEEVQEYIDTKGYTFTGQEFIDHYEAVGWKYGKTGNLKPVVSWKACCNTWANSRKPKPTKADIEAAEIKARFKKRGIV